MLTRLKRQPRHGPGMPGRDAGPRSDGGLTGADRRELVELREQNRRLREDAGILKWVRAIFAAAAR